MNRHSDDQLIDGFLTGQKEAHAMIHGWISSQLNYIPWVPRSDHDDIHQEVDMNLLVNLKENRFKHQSSLKTYIYRITKYKCVDYLRLRAKKKHDDIDTVAHKMENREGNPELSMEKTEREEIYFKILRSMPEKCLSLWQMLFIKKWNHREIADKLSVPEGTIHRRAWDCRKKAIALRKKYDKSE